jgi:hypothetical protein
LLPFYRSLQKENDRLRAQLEKSRADQAEWARFFPPGHFYSPLPSRAEIAEAFARGGFGPPFPAINLNEAEQFARLERFAAWYPEQPFPEKPTEGARFYLDNPSYGHYDACMLYGMLREARPRRIIEVGSGFSSAAMLDLNERLFGGGVQFTFIDPDMSRLRQLLRADDSGRVTLIEKRVQEVPLETFTTLRAHDVLFIFQMKHTGFDFDNFTTQAHRPGAKNVNLTSGHSGKKILHLHHTSLKNFVVGG